MSFLKQMLYNFFFVLLFSFFFFLLHPGWINRFWELLSIGECFAYKNENFKMTIQCSISEITVINFPVWFSSFFFRKSLCVFSEGILQSEPDPVTGLFPTTYGVPGLPLHQVQLVKAVHVSSREVISAWSVIVILSKHGFPYLTEAHGNNLYF